MPEIYLFFLHSSFTCLLRVREALSVHNNVRHFWKVAPVSNITFTDSPFDWIVETRLTREPGDCTMSSLLVVFPRDVILHILRFVDPKAVIRSRVLCKEWKDIVDDKFLWFHFYLSASGSSPSSTAFQADVDYVALFVFISATCKFSHLS